MQILEKDSLAKIKDTHVEGC